ncbi:hypothetical protein GN958_ATG09075 [Phytophthora infestans]|uniref:Uncharacterized protein n=1 Tax=Phytophthora infestans TaxID=4787 RepID=A0A8S9ULI8_PHYIN|nr:hypothetical protein GN958_ATG09075 [Phytophthora infestans]
MTIKSQRFHHKRMARVKPKGRPRRGGRSRHVQQYKLNAESVDKKLAVLVMLKTTGAMRATISHFYPNLAAASYKSNQRSANECAEERDRCLAASGCR